MPVMLSKTYDAFIAAEELAAYENRFARIETALAVLRADMTALKWMLGINLAASVSILIKVFV
jgi:hypothetical protein